MNKQEITFIEKYGNKVVTPTGEEYYYIPYWFKSEKNNGIYKSLSFESLPKDFKEYVKKSREDIKNKK